MKQLKVKLIATSVTCTLEQLTMSLATNSLMFTDVSEDDILPCNIFIQGGMSLDCLAWNKENDNNFTLLPIITWRTQILQYSILFSILLQRRVFPSNLDRRRKQISTTHSEGGVVSLLVIYSHGSLSELYLWSQSSIPSYLSLSVRLCV